MPVHLWRMAFAAGLAFYLDAAHGHLGRHRPACVAIPIGLALWEGSGTCHCLDLAFAIALGSLVGGWLGDRFGRARVFTLDLMIFVLGTVLIITVAGRSTSIIGVIVVGLAAGGRYRPPPSP